MNTDTIWNHMAGVESGTGVGGSSFTHYNYPGIYQNQDFHHCGLEPGDYIVNYGNAQEVQTCELVNLAEYVLNSFWRNKTFAHISDIFNDNSYLLILFSPCVLVDIKWQALN